MIKIENTKVFGWEGAIRGMRNPMNSWNKSDSGWCYTYKRVNDQLCLNCPWNNANNECTSDNQADYVIGPNDLKLMKNLAKAGSDHRKFMRMIAVQVDITAPLYWWKEFSTYRVGVAPNPTDIEMNSCSTMHKIMSKEFTLDDFSHEHLFTIEEGHESLKFLEHLISGLNHYRNEYLQLKNKNRSPKENILMKRYWWQVIQLLPTSYNQRRTIMMNYEVLANMYGGRNFHNLDEWPEFCRWIDTLPYSEIIKTAAGVE